MSKSDSTPHLDFEHIKQYVGDDTALTQEIFGLFKHQVDMWVRLLIVDVDDETWVSILHSIKGSARAVGAKKLADVCEQGETMIDERSGSAIREVNVHDVQFCIDKVLIEIGRWEYRQTLASMRS